MNTIISQELAKYTLPTDLVKEVEATTSNHYSLNARFEVIREGKVHFITIKEVGVIGQVIKSHTRLEVDTDLKPVVVKTIDTEKIQSEILALESWFKVHVKMKNSRAWISNEKKFYRLKAKLEK